MTVKTAFLGKGADMSDQPELELFQGVLYESLEMSHKAKKHPSFVLSDKLFKLLLIRGQLTPAVNVAALSLAMLFSC